MAKAAEGVTLSGVRTGRDCVPIALRRSPLAWVPKVKDAVSACAENRSESLRQKDGALRHFKRLLLVLSLFLFCKCPIGDAHFPESNRVWLFLFLCQKHFNRRLTYVAKNH